MSSYLAFWGKGRPWRDVPMHPAAYHCLDVAACAHVLLERLPRLRGRLELLLGSISASRLIVALVALHDVGKWSRQFQAQADTLWPAELGDIATAPSAPRHDEAGLALWRTHLHTQVPGGLDLLPLARAVYGHHRTPVAEQPHRLPALFGRHGLRCAEDFAYETIALLLPAPEALPPTADLTRASWLVAGLTMIADWLGSSQAVFEYERPDYDLATYWRTMALPRARDAVERSGVIPTTSAPVQPFAALIAAPDWIPTPMQAWAASVPAEPGLYIVEDMTGAGKTEAALMLAHRLIAAGHAEGLYIALPTMATSDGMFDRMAAVYRRLFDPAGRPSLALAHGAREFHQGFQRSILDPASDSYCAEWIADESRLTFLAQVGVGTVDQAILSVLPSHCQCVRMMGLAQRVLVLDEIHGYDAYMSQEIVRLVEAQAAFGGSTILLSATLPANIKRRLLTPYDGREIRFSSNYPLATVAGVRAAAILQTGVEPRAASIRDVPLTFVESADEGLQRTTAAARAGQAVLYIRNTIRDAVNTFQAVPADLMAELFHGRFALCDRQRIQGAALARFGKDSTPKQRAGRLLVATQVVEQSLDLDFDLIVTDLAPVDLIIQRAGRLWRHARPRPASAVREMVVVGPAPDPQATADWLWQSLPGTGAVYRDHARLWLSAEILRTTGRITAPGGLRNLIEHVYGSGAEERVPAALAAQAIEAEGQRGAARGIAQMGTLRLTDGYALMGPWHSEERVPTRLGADTATVRLAVARDGAVIPWAATRTAETDAAHVWALSECRAPAHWIDGDVIPTKLTTAANIARANWAEWQREARPLLIVDPSGAIGADLTYSPRLGLRKNAA
jgi:CRISPR-associated endonuclease/helicase Cas3